MTNTPGGLQSSLIGRKPPGRAEGQCCGTVSAAGSCSPAEPVGPSTLFTIPVLRYTKTDDLGRAIGLDRPSRNLVINGGVALL